MKNNDAPADLQAVVWRRNGLLDILGILPTAEEVRTFLDDRLPSDVKRAKLIDRLLASPAYADHWAEKWSQMLKKRQWERWLEKGVVDPAEKRE